MNNNFENQKDVLRHGGPEEYKEGNFEVLSLGILALEKSVGDIYFEDDESVKIAGVRFKKVDLSADEVAKVVTLKSKIAKVLQTTSRRVLLAVKASTLLAALGLGYTTLDINKPEKYADKGRARQELADRGITEEQRLSAYKPGISELLYEAIKPLGYQDDVDQREFLGTFFKYLENEGLPNAGMVQDVIPNVVQGREKRANKLKKFYSAPGRGLEGLSAQAISPSEMPALDDAWSLYLGLSQKHNTFGISEHKPQRSHEDKYYFKINSFWDDFFRGGVSPSWTENNLSSESAEEIRHGFSEGRISPNSIESAVRALRFLGGEKKSVIMETEYLATEGGDVMYHFTMSLGEDENGTYISYYDKWDLASFFAENVVTKGVGKPFEIYDRLYYDPVTYKIKN